MFYLEKYFIPEFVLTTEEGNIIWKDLNIAVSSHQFSVVHMILPYTMFDGMKLKF